MNYKLKIFFTFLCFQTLIVNAQSKVDDFLGIPGPIKIDNQEFNLVWSSNPTDNYYKQEYLTSSDKLENYQKMIIIEFIQGDFTLDIVINQKISELESLKKSNPIVNYIVYENEGEYILDFLLSENTEDGKEIKIAERNVYRYKIISNNDKKGVLLFAISERGYPNNLKEFFNNLNENNIELIQSVGSYKLPQIKIK